VSLTAGDFMLVTGIAVGINASVVGPGIPIGVSWANDTFMTISASNLALLYAAEDELAGLNTRAICDEECIKRKATLTERIRNLK